jgi:ABC-type sugar transport system ATPase subunit
MRPASHPRMLAPMQGQSPDADSPLSKGNRQKVQPIAALASRADLPILDEPTVGLDPLMGVAFRGCVGEARRRGQTVLLSSHILSEVEALCDRVGIVRRWLTGRSALALAGATFVALTAGVIAWICARAQGSTCHCLR